MERKGLPCEFKIDTACVEVKYADGSMISIDCAMVEHEVARNMFEASELDDQMQGCRRGWKLGAYFLGRKDVRGAAGRC